EDIRNRDLHDPLRIAMQGLKRSLAVAQDPEAAQAIFEEQRPVLGDGDSPRASLQELRAEMLLETGDPPADLGLGKSQQFPRLGEALRLDHLGEDDEISKIEHRSSLPPRLQRPSLGPLLPYLQQFVPALVTSPKTGL